MQVAVALKEESKKPFQNPYKIPQDPTFYKLQSTLTYLDGLEPLEESYSQHPLSETLPTLSYAVNHYILAFIENALQGCHDDLSASAQIYAYLHSEIFGEASHDERFHDLSTLVYGGRTSFMDPDPDYLAFFTDNPQFFAEEVAIKEKVSDFLSQLPETIIAGRNPRFYNQFNALAQHNEDSMDEFSQRKFELALKKSQDPSDTDVVLFSDPINGVLLAKPA